MTGGVRRAVGLDHVSGGRTKGVACQGRGTRNAAGPDHRIEKRAGQGHVIESGSDQGRVNEIAIIKSTSGVKGREVGSARSITINVITSYVSS